MEKNSNLYNATKKILKEVRFGNLANRLDKNSFPNDIEFVNDFNSMLETINDREKMISEYKNYILGQSEHLKTLFNLLNEGAMTLSSDYKIISINDTQAKWFRTKKKNLLGNDLLRILKKYTIKEYPSNKKITNFELFFAKDRKNYNLIIEFKKFSMTFSVSIKKFLTNEEKENYFIIAKDITSDINLQKLKDTFMATLTHDLKVPIVAESKVLELLLNETFGKNSPIQKEAFLNLQANNNDMMSLVQTILDTHKLEDFAYEILPEYFNVKELVEVETEKLKFLAQEKNSKIKITCQEDLPQIYADKKELSRVLKNITTNAINFTPENEDVTIKISTDAKNFFISITDKGNGIEQENIPFIFDRYYTTDKKYRKVGTGLGLYLSKKIINLHGGEIQVKSIKNKETTFTIILPIS